MPTATLNSCSCEAREPVPDSKGILSRHLTVWKSISQLFDNEVAQTIQKNGTVTYSVKKDEFYVISGNFGDNTYYERMTISSRCPAIYNGLRIFHPKVFERALDGLVTRMSNSLRATCQGAEGAAKIK